MLRNVIFLILYFAVNLCYSQDLEFLYQEARNSSNIKQAQKVRDLALEKGDEKILANTYFLLAYLYKGEDEFYEAVLNYVKAVKYYRKLGDIRSVSLVIENLGVIYNESGFKNTAISYFNDALYLKRQLNDSKGEVYTLYNIGQTYLSSNLPDSALQYYNKALKLALTLNHNYIGRIYNDMGSANRAKGKFDKSREYYDLADQTDKTSGMMARTLNNRGNSYLQEGKKDLAVKCFKKALSKSKVDPRTLSFIYGNLGKIQNHPDSAIHFYETSFTYLKERPLTLMSEYYATSKELERLYATQNNEVKEAYYDGLQDDFTEELITLQEQLRALYLQYQVEAATWKIESEEKTVLLARANTIKEYIIVGLLIALVLLIVLFIYSQRLKNNNKNLKGDNVQLEGRYNQLQKVNEENEKLKRWIEKRASEVQRIIKSP